MSVAIFCCHTWGRCSWVSRGWKPGILLGIYSVLVESLCPTPC
jgi:hypothetical protein